MPLSSALLREGLLLIPCGRNAIRMTPALNVPQHLLTEGLQVFANVLAELEPAHV